MSETAPEHIVKSFEVELQRLRTGITEMGGPGGKPGGGGSPRRRRTR